MAEALELEISQIEECASVSNFDDITTSSGLLFARKRQKLLSLQKPKSIFFERMSQ